MQTQRKYSSIGLCSINVCDLLLATLDCCCCGIVYTEHFTSLFILHCRFCQMRCYTHKCTSADYWDGFYISFSLLNRLTDGFAIFFVRIVKCDGSSLIYCSLISHMNGTLALYGLQEIERMQIFEQDFWMNVIRLLSSVEIRLISMVKK